MQERPYLSIGEVLGLLLEEFPDVTISKIRFLESQGLIDPERTASGYRKFYDNDVDLLRVILREQRENFLPLRVIRDRLESGAIEDPTGPTTPPRGIRNVESSDDEEIAFAATSAAVETQHHPAGQQRVTPADLLAEMVQNGPPPVAHVVSAPVPRQRIVPVERAVSSGRPHRRAACRARVVRAADRQGQRRDRHVHHRRPRHRAGCCRFHAARCRGPPSPCLATGR